MLKILRHLAPVAALLCGWSLGAVGASAEDAAPDRPIAIVIHGGAGALEPGRYTDEEESAFKAKLGEALDAGYGVLEQGGAALDAVEAAIVVMEDSELFNAGKGAVFTRDGKNELDASIMDGASLNAGAIAGVTRVKNPIRLARAVMENSEHVMFSGEGAEEFAGGQDLEFVEPAYFHTERRWKALQEAREREKMQKEGALPHDLKYGTVGAVALDRAGDLAAGTSTGGMTMKRYGRVGDAPIIGGGHVRRQQVLRGLVHRLGRIFHQADDRARYLRPGRIRWQVSRRRGRRRHPQSPPDPRRRRRRHRPRARWRARFRLQFQRHVPRREERRRRSRNRDIRKIRNRDARPLSEAPPPTVSRGSRMRATVCDFGLTAVWRKQTVDANAIDCRLILSCGHAEWLHE